MLTSKKYLAKQNDNGESFTTNMSNRQSKKGDWGHHERTGKRKDQFFRKRINFIGVPILIPNSISVLPDPLWLRAKDIEKVRSFERSFYQDNKIKPGQYSSWKKVKRILFPVHDRLIDEVENRIEELDGTSLAIQLYDQLEIMYGTLEKYRLEAMAMTALTANQQIPLEFDREWRKRSPQLLGIRYLIELTVKIGSKACKTVTNQILLELMALGTRIAEMDAFLDHVYHNVVPHELLVTKDMTADLRLSESGIRCIQLWENARKERLFHQNLEYLEGTQKIISEPIKESQLTEEKIWKKLDEPLKSELGYSLTEWLHLLHALIAYFDDYERLKVVPKEDFVQYLRDYTKIEPHIIDLFLDDRILSQRRMLGSSRNDMLPSEKFWRDLRLTNRPIVEVKEGGVPLVILGVETVQQGSQVYFQLLTEGRVQLARAEPKGPIASAFGAINEKAGNIFRDEIVSSCRKMGFEAIPEKASIKGIKVPKGVGPVDVFVFDKPHRRFVLVEAKDISVRITPKELKEQKEEFIGKAKDDTKCVLNKLYAQEQWFRSLLPALKEEYGLGTDQEVTIEGVVVVSHPMMWVFSHNDAIPVQDNYGFFRKLKAGEALIYRPS